MKTKQIRKFKKELENSGLIPWRNPKELTSLLVSSMSPIVQENGALWLSEFHDPLREYFQWLYDNKRILRSYSIEEKIKWREECSERTLTEEEKKEVEEGLEQKSSGTLGSVAESYLERVYLAEKPFSIKRCMDVLREHFKCGKPESVYLLPLSFNTHKPTKKNYEMLLKEAMRIEKIVDAVIMPSSKRRREKNLTSRRYDARPEGYELNKLKKMDFNKVDKFDAKEVYDKVRKIYNELILEFRISKVAYSSLDKAVEFLGRYLDFSSLQIARKIYLPVKSNKNSKFSHPIGEVLVGV